MKKYLMIFQSAPYDGSKALEGLELTLAIATFAQPVSIIFTDNGILQLLKYQNPDLIHFKDFTKVYKALDLFDIKNLYLSKSSLEQFNIQTEDLLMSPTLIDDKQITEIINQHQVVLTF